MKIIYKKLIHLKHLKIIIDISLQLKAQGCLPYTGNHTNANKSCLFVLTSRLSFNDT